MISSHSEFVEIPKELEDSYKIEKLIWEATDDSLNQVKSLISRVNQHWCCSLIFGVSLYHEFKFKELANLYVECIQKDIKYYAYDAFASYLYQLKIITKDQFDDEGLPPDDYFKTVYEYENPIAKDTIGYYIMQDDVNEFVNYISINNIKDIIYINISLQNKSISGIHLIMKCGAINILKYLNLNQQAPYRDGIENAVLSGNENIIEFLASLDYSFNDTLDLAIMSHHNKIAFWLMENYEHDGISTTDCISWFNMEMFFYFHFNPNCGFCYPNFDDPYLVSCSIADNFDLAKYLLANGEDPLIENEWGQNAIEAAHNQELKNLLLNYHKKK